MNTSDLLKLIDELTRDWRYAGECGGDLYCFFCGEWQNTPDDNDHEPDCPYIKARALIDAQQQQLTDEEIQDRARQLQTLLGG